MKKNFTFFVKTSFWFFMLFCTIQNINAQVGIGTTSPEATSALDVTSTTQGMLTPRMTTVQKNAIVSPANGLLVYDTTIKTFSYYDLPTTTWVDLLQERNNFKRIKATDVLTTVLAPELAAGGGTKYLMDSQTLYEINGSVQFALPIEINNSYIVGLDSGDDKIIKLGGGDLFTGTTGGSLRVLTLINNTAGGKVFNITAPNTQNLIFRDLVIANSASVGTLSGFGFVFSSIVQYSGNTTGITYNNITKVLLSNQGWFGNNQGSYETFTGTFELIGKQGGFTEVAIANAIGIDVSSNPTVTVDGGINGVVFTGTPSGTGAFIKPYTGAGTYAGYNFTKNWDVNSHGVPYEGDAYSVGDVNFDYAVGSGFLTNISSTPTKVLGATTSTRMYRASNGGVDNRITYLGNKKRIFSVSAFGSFQPTNGVNTIYIFYIAKNGVVINQSKTYAFSTNNIDIRSFPLQAIVELNPNDYVEVFVQQYSGSSNILSVSLNLFMF